MPKTIWISTHEANVIADTALTDRRFRDKFRPIIRHKQIDPRCAVKWDRDAVMQAFGVKEETTS